MDSDTGTTRLVGVRDVDEEKFGDALARLGIGVEEGEVLLQGVDMGVETEADDVTRVSLDLDFAMDVEHRGLFMMLFEALSGLEEGYDRDDIVDAFDDALIESVEMDTPDEAVVFENNEGDNNE